MRLYRNATVFQHLSLTFLPISYHPRLNLSSFWKFPQALFSSFVDQSFATPELLLPWPSPFFSVGFTHHLERLWLAKIFWDYTSFSMVIFCFLPSSSNSIYIWEWKDIETLPLINISCFVVLLLIVLLECYNVCF